MGRNASGVRGIKLRSGDTCVGMVVADPEAHAAHRLRKWLRQADADSGRTARPTDEAAAEAGEAAERADERR